MENYKKISLFLLLSTIVTIGAYNPCDTLGSPDFTDFDDQSGGPLPILRSRDYGKTALEQEIQNQTSTPQPAPKKNPNPFLEKQKQREQEANRLANEFLDLCATLEARTTFEKARSAAETTYTAALEEITAARKLGFYEKIGVVVTAVVGVAAFTTDTFENAPRYAAIAGASVLATAWSYFPRRLNCNKAEQEITAAHQTIVEVATATTRYDRPDSELIREAEAKLTELKRMATVVDKGFIAKQEARLNALKEQAR